MSIFFKFSIQFDKKISNRYTVVSFYKIYGNNVYIYI